MISNKILKYNDQNGHLSYGANSGMFFIYNPGNAMVSNPRTCREEFSWGFSRRTKFVGFRGGNSLKIELINEFWENIENKLKLENKTVIYPTPLKSIIILELSPFWTQNTTTRSLFTLLLRCSAVYYKGDMNKALQSYNLSNKILPVINWFLKGNTKPTYRRLTNTGIVSHFHIFAKKRIRYGYGFGNYYYDYVGNPFVRKDYKELLVKP